eukprot:scaffold1511_cov170-Amphora_coffeaeformis.AAC.22
MASKWPFPLDQCVRIGLPYAHSPTTSYKVVSAPGKNRLDATNEWMRPTLAWNKRRATLPIGLTSDKTAKVKRKGQKRVVRRELLWSCQDPPPFYGISQNKTGPRQ